MSWWRRPPDAELMLSMSQSKTATEAMSKMRVFSDLCMTHKVDVKPPGPGQPQAFLIVSGRPRRVAAFYADYQLLRGLGVV